MHQQGFQQYVLDENFLPALITLRNFSRFVTQVSAGVGDGSSSVFLFQPRYSWHETCPAFPLMRGRQCCQTEHPGSVGVNSHVECGEQWFYDLLFKTAAWPRCLSWSHSADVI